MKWLRGALAALSLVIVAVVTGGEAEAITLWGYFVDDNGSTFEGDIDAIAREDITRG